MIQKCIDWYGKPAVYGFIAVALALVAVGLYLYADTDEPESPRTRDTAVTTERVSALSSARTLVLIGDVEAVDQNEITAEASGRVVRIHTSLGDMVRAGQVIAELENASERAAVLQAEGAYEAALAAAAQSDVGVDEAQDALEAAEDDAVTTMRNAFNTFRTILLNDIDDIFSDPSGQLPGVRIDGGGHTTYLNRERIRFQSVLEVWQQRAATLTSDADLESELAYARERLTELAQMLEVVITQVNDRGSVGNLTSAELQALSSTLTADRSSVNNTLASIDAAMTALRNAENALERARLGGTNTDVSAANAQVKQALGSLRAAQANLEKTVLRTSISGAVNSLSVKIGDFVGQNQVIARIANNDALEVTTYISETERDRIAIGDTVMLAGEYEGIVTNIAPAVDPDTRKIEVKIASEASALENGDTVRITLDSEGAPIDENAPLSIPISALKVETDRTVVFTVSDSMELIAHEVVVGPLLGNNVLIESGITPEMEIVVDARGFNEGDTVTLRN